MGGPCAAPIHEPIEERGSRAGVRCEPVRGPSPACHGSLPMRSNVLPDGVAVRRTLMVKTEFITSAAYIHGCFERIVRAACGMTMWTYAK